VIQKETAKDREIEKDLVSELSKTWITRISIHFWSTSHGNDSKRI